MRTAVVLSAQVPFSATPLSVRTKTIKNCNFKVSIIVCFSYLNT